MSRRVSSLKQFRGFEMFETENYIVIRNLGDKTLYISEGSGKPAVSAKKNNNAFILEPSEFITLTKQTISVREPIRSIPAEWS